MVCAIDSRGVRKIGRKSEIYRAARSVCTGAVFELLESRRLMSLLGISLDANAAQIQTGSAGSIQYTPTNQNYSISTTDLTLVQPNGQDDAIGSDPSHGVSQAGSVAILVNSSGGLVGGNGIPAGADISLQGDVTINGTPYDGTLLTGSILQFGYQFTNTGASPPLPAGSATFDFRFRATGGLLQSLYFQGADIGMVINGTSSTPFSSGLIGPNENWDPFDVTDNIKGFLGPITPLKVTPSIITAASFQNSTGNVVGSAIPEDSAILSGGFQESGPITFTLTAPDGSTADTEVITPSGDGTYSTSNANVATQVGTYTWQVSYAGDAFNNPANDQGGAAEQVKVVPASPTISTNATETTNVVGTALLSDSVTVSGGDHPTGTVSFTLSKPDGSTVSAGTVTINGDGTYTGPTSIPATEVGTYTFHATYAGDSLNNGAVDNGNNESVSTVKASPSISTKASENGNVVGTATLTDSVTVIGGDNPTGTVTFTLTKPDTTTVSAGTMTIAGDGTYTVSPAVLATEVGTYTWHATYAGDSLNNGAVDQGGVAEQLTIVSPPGGMISGTKYNDLTGNGFSADDTPLGGITINLYQGTSASGTPFRTTVTAANGTYSFSSLPNGTYFVQESVPANSVETGGLLGYVVTVSAGTNSTGNNFDDFQEECNLSKFSCIYYVINGCQTVTELSGNVQPGDEVTAYFTVAANYSDSVSLVSYITPDNYFNANDANQQVIYDQKTLSFTTGSCAQTFCLGPVQIPLCDYQIDFVCGPAINAFGPAGSNIFYHPQNRIFDSSNGGCQQCSTAGSDISGIVYCDANLDKTLDCCEDLICGATVSLETTGGKVLQTTTTGSNGSYAFENLAPGTYLVVVTPPGGDSAETSNTITVVLPNKQDPQLNPMGNDADLNFAELCHCSAIQGSCWDDCNNDGKIDYNECGVICVTINLSGVDCLGNKVSLSCKTDDDGDYCFSGLLPGCYTICEGQPGGFTQGTNTCGTVNGSVCGSKTGTDTFCNIQISNCGDAGIGYNFGEHCTTNDCKGACASTSFWKNSNGQALLCKLNGSANSCALGQWLSNTFPDMYSHVLVNGTYVNFANLTNAQIAWFFVNCDYNVYTAKLNTQVLAAALNCYATSTNLCGGTYASAYGFTTSANGSGYDLINVGSNGAAFGVSNNSNISILQALNAADDDAVNGVLYATSEVVNGTYYSATTLQNMALTVFTSINNTGGIT